MSEMSDEASLFSFPTHRDAAGFAAEVRRLGLDAVTSTEEVEGTGWLVAVRGFDARQKRAVRAATETLLAQGEGSHE